MIECSKLKVIVFYFVILISTNWLYGFQDLRFDHLTDADGLSDNSVTAIVEDSAGYMWFGSYNGLNKYDGISITSYNYRELDDTSITDDHITSLFNDSKGQLWIGTRNGGLVKYNSEQDSFTSFTLLGESSQVGIEIRSIVEDNKGHIWVATIAYGLFRITSEGKIINYTNSLHSNPRLESNNITALCFDRNLDQLLIGSKSPFIEILDITTNAISKTPLISEDETVYTKNIVLDKFGGIWAATYKSGLFHIKKNGKVLNLNARNSNIRHNILFNLLYNPDSNTIWLATDGGGILTYNIENNNFTQISKSYSPESLSSNSVLSIYSNKSDFIWIGTQYGGVNIYNKLHQQYNTLNIYQGLSHNRIKCFLQYSESLFYIGTDGGGLCLFDRKKNTIKVIDLGISDLTINTLWKSTNESLIVGTYGRGLIEYDPRTKTSKNIIPRNFLDNNSSEIFIQDVIEFNNVIWFATPYGLYYLNKENKVFPIELDNPDAIADKYQLNSLKCLTMVDGYIWAGTKAGFVQIDIEKKRVEEYFKIVPSTGLTPTGKNIVNRIKNFDNKLYLCTDRGLEVFDLKKASILKTAGFKDLNATVINDIVFLDDKQFWIATGRGLATYGIDNGNIHYEDNLKGLQGNSITRIYVATDGELYIGGNKGINHFYPEELRLNTHLPPLVFTDFKLFNKHVDFSRNNSLLSRHISKYEKITLNSSQNDISFDFVALDYNLPHQLSYSYILENYDQEWNHVDNKTTASYTNLPPGQFELKIKASNAEETWHTKMLTMQIIILPPWYKTSWALVCYVLLIVLLLYVFFKIVLNWTNLNHRLEIEKLEKQKTESLNKERIEFFTNISHEFKTPLSLILAPIDDMIEKGSGTSDDFSLIKKNANRLLRLINQLMDFRRNEINNLNINLATFEINSFVREILYSFQNLADQQNISLAYKACTDTCIELDNDKLDKILFNLLSNAFKACKGGDSIVVSSSFKNNYLELRVEDSGKGISTQNLNRIFDRFFQIEQNSGGTGVGLSLTKRYLELLNGKIEVESEYAVGTTFIISIPVEFSNNYDKNPPVESTGLIPQVGYMDTIINPLSPSKKILIVEDDLDILNYLYQKLSVNYQVFKAVNGVEGLNMTLENWPDMIISDVMMPGTTGFDLCKKVKTDIRTNHIPVILLTAMSSEEGVIEGVELGADLYIPKPFNLKLLFLQIKTLFSNIEKRQIKYKEAILDPKEGRNGEKQMNLFIEQATKVVLDNILMSAFTVEDLSRELAMHRTNLHHKLTSLTGIAPSEFIRSIKLKESLEPLREGSKSISEIAYSVGFNTPAYFSKCFKNQYGCLPGEYKNHLGEVN